MISQVLSANQLCQYLNTLIKQSLQMYQAGMLDDAKLTLQEFHSHFQTSVLLQASYIELNLLLLSLVKLREQMEHDGAARWIAELIEAYCPQENELPDFIWDISQKNHLFIAGQTNPELARHNRLSRFDEQSLCCAAVGNKTWRKNLELLSRYREQSDDYPEAKQALITIINNMSVLHHQCTDQDKALYRVNYLVDAIHQLEVLTQATTVDVARQCLALQAIKVALMAENLLVLPKWMIRRVAFQLQRALQQHQTRIQQLALESEQQMLVETLHQQIPELAESLGLFEPTHAAASASVPAIPQSPLQRCLQLCSDYFSSEKVLVKQLPSDDLNEAHASSHAQT